MAELMLKTMENQGEKGGKCLSIDFFMSPLEIVTQNSTVKGVKFATTALQVMQLILIVINLLKIACKSRTVMI